MLKKHDPHARRKRTRTTDASQQHKRVAASNVVCQALWKADHCNAESKQIMSFSSDSLMIGDMYKNIPAATEDERNCSG